MPFICFEILQGASANELAGISFIAGFSCSRPAEPSDKWTDIEWVLWGLANCPRIQFYNQAALDHSDKGDWTL